MTDLLLKKQLRLDAFVTEGTQITRILDQRKSIYQQVLFLGRAARRGMRKGFYAVCGLIKGAILALQ